MCRTMTHITERNLPTHNLVVEAMLFNSIEFLLPSIPDVFPMAFTFLLFCIPLVDFRAHNVHAGSQFLMRSLENWSIGSLRDVLAIAVWAGLPCCFGRGCSGRAEVWAKPGGAQASPHSSPIPTTPMDFCNSGAMNGGRSLRRTQSPAPFGSVPAR